MRRTILTIVLAVGMSLASFAQVSFGVKAGLNLTSMSFDKSEWDKLFKDKNGFFFGPTVNISLPITGMGIDAAVLYDQREADASVYTDFSDKATTEKVKQKSIMIPVNFRVGFGLGDLVNFFAFAGPQFGFNIGDKSKDLFGAYEWAMKSSNLSANLGLGILIDNHLQVTANYNIMLGKTGEFKAKEGYEQMKDVLTGDAKANAWQIAVAYYF